MLSQIPIAKEIKKVVFSLGSNMAPGPGGMSAHFYKFYWNIIGGDIIEAITSFFYEGLYVEGNKSFFYCPYSQRQ